MLAMHPQNNNHDIISEHELKKNLSVQKVTKTRPMKWTTMKSLFLLLF